MSFRVHEDGLLYKISEVLYSSIGRLFSNIRDSEPLSHLNYSNRELLNVPEKVSVTNGIALSMPRLVTRALTAKSQIDCRELSCQSSRCPEVLLMEIYIYCETVRSILRTLYKRDTLHYPHSAEGLD